MRLLLLATVLGLSGCRAVVGIEERQLEPAKASTSSSAASTSTTGAGGGTGGAGGGCGDVASDNHNCGVCNHDCLGGACIEGKCQPFFVSETPYAGQEQGLAADPGVDGNIYWGEFRFNPGLFSVPKSGGVATTLLSGLPDGGWLADLTMRDQTIYFTDYSDSDSDASRGVYSINNDGSNLQQITGGNVLGTVSVAINQGYLYYCNEYDPLAIARVPLVGGNVEPILQLPGAGSSVVYFLRGGILVDDYWVYYGHGDGDTPGSGGVYRVGHDGTGNHRLFQADDGTIVVGLNDGELYWKENDGYVYHGHADGTGTHAKLAQMDSQLIFHDGYIYGERGPNMVRVQSNVQSPGEELVWFGDDPTPLTTDGVSLIWVEHYTGSVYRLAF